MGPVKVTWHRKCFPGGPPRLSLASSRLRALWMRSKCARFRRLRFLVAVPLGSWHGRCGRMGRSIPRAGTRPENAHLLRADMSRRRAARREDVPGRHERPTRNPWPAEYLKTPDSYVWGTEPSLLARELAEALHLGARVL